MSAVDIRQYLEDQGVIEGATGWDGSINFLKDSPDTLVAIYDTGGPAANPFIGVDERYPTFQVRARGEASQTGEDALDTILAAIYTTLHRVTNTAINGTTYKFIVASGDVLSLGRDANGRPEKTQNYRAGVLT